MFTKDLGNQGVQASTVCVLWGGGHTVSFRVKNDATKNELTPLQDFTEVLVDNSDDDNEDTR